MRNDDWIKGLHLEEQLRDKKVSENQKKLKKKKQMKENQRKAITEMMQTDEDYGLYEPTTSRKTFDHPDSIEQTKSFDELAQLIRAWAKEKGILSSSPMGLLKQLGKFFEEAGELSGAIIKSKDIEEVKLEMGDVFVTLLILCGQLGIESNEALGAAYDKISGRKGKTIEGVFIKESDL